MGELDALTRRGAHRPPTGVPTGAPFVEATVATTATSDTEEVWVLIDQEDSQLRDGPCRWMPRPSATGPVFPSRGDRALVVMSDRGRRHLVWWEPAA